jgi:hypothetical protein
MNAVKMSLRIIPSCSYIFQLFEWASNPFSEKLAGLKAISDRVLIRLVAGRNQRGSGLFWGQNPHSLT